MLNSPPPLPGSAELPLIVQLMIVGEAASQKIPPPLAKLGGDENVACPPVTVKPSRTESGPSSVANVITLQKSTPVVHMLPSIVVTSAPPVLCTVTALPEVVVVRVLAHQALAARETLAQAWEILRPLVNGTPALRPRIWST